MFGRAAVPSPYLDSAGKELRDRCGPGHLGAKLESRGRRASGVVCQQRRGSSLRAGFGSALFLRGGFGDAESDATTLYPFRVNSWPSSDPLVTSVGGTMLNLDDSGSRLSPDVVWNDGFGAGGGGVSGVFPRPVYQAGVTREVGKKRGTPDISMSAAVNGGAWIYTSFGGVSVGWHIIGGTSEASPKARAAPLAFSFPPASPWIRTACFIS